MSHADELKSLKVNLLEGSSKKYKDIGVRGTALNEKQLVKARLETMCKKAHPSPSKGMMGRGKREGVYFGKSL